MSECLTDQIRVHGIYLVYEQRNALIELNSDNSNRTLSRKLETKSGKIVPVTTGQGVVRLMLQKFQVRSEELPEQL